MFLSSHQNSNTFHPGLNSRKPHAQLTHLSVASNYPHAPSSITHLNVQSWNDSVCKVAFFCRNEIPALSAPFNQLEFYSLVLIRYWLVTPGWSTSWILEAKMAAKISSGVNTDWKEKYENVHFKLDIFIYLEVWRIQEDVSGLGNICCMKVIVIWNVFDIVVL